MALVICYSSAAAPAFSATSSAAPDKDGLIGTVAEVRVFDRGGDVRRSGSGTVMGSRLVLSSAELVTGASRITVARLADNAELRADVIAEDQHLGLVWLLVDGLGGKPVTVARDPVVPGQPVFAVSVDRAAPGGLRIRPGAVGARLRFSDDPEALLFHHNALIDRVGYGGPVLNDCGQLAGVHRPEPSRRLLSSGADIDPESIVYAVGALGIVRDAANAGVTVNVSESECVPALERAQDALDDARSAAEGAEAEAEAAAERAAALEAEAQKAMQRAEASEEERAAAREAAEAARAEAEAAAAAANEAAAALQAAEERAAELEAEVEGLRTDLDALTRTAEAVTRERDDAQRTLLYGGIAGAAVLILLLIVFTLVTRGQARRRRESEEAAEAQLQAKDAEVARDRERAQPYADVLLDGVGDDGQRLSVKISGAHLLEGEPGARIGRHPENEGVVVDPSVSRQHVMLRVEDGRLYLRSLSGSETLVNGAEMRQQQEVEVRHGSEIVLGGAALRLHIL